MQLPQIFFRLAYPLLKVKWFFTRPRRFGAAVIIEHQGSVLLIRTSYGDRRWNFPGGGIKQGEAPADAAKREVGEEVGIKLSHVQLLGDFYWTKEYKRNTAYVFYARVESGYCKIDGREISEAAWFPKNNLPELADYGRECLKFVP
jgi:mutator protein MutT